MSTGITLGVLFLTCGGPAAGQLVSEDPQLQRFPAAWRYVLYIRPSPLSDFNRVDGLVQSVTIHGRIPTHFDRPPVLAGYSRVDVHTVELPHYRVRGGMIGVAANLPCSHLGGRDGWWATLSTQYHKQTTSPDDWIVGRTENTLAALLTKHDYKNYFQIEGYDISAAIRHVPSSQILAITVQAAWSDNAHRPLAVATQWSLLPWQRNYRPNYPAMSGRERRICFTAGLKIKDTPRLPRRVVNMSVAGEKAGGQLGGDFEFDGIFGSFNIKSAIAGNQWLTARLVGGARTGDLAQQRQLRLGGIGTLRGMPHQALTGNRFWMLNVEYHLGGDLLGRLAFFPFTTGPIHKVLPVIDVGLLYDLGAAYQVSTTDDVLTGWFGGKAHDNWGVFLSVVDDLVRVEWVSSRFLGHEYSDMVRLRTGWRL